ncbi:endonuclease/exonuclease/phosphatase family protein [uncultured Rikenella sp.]
MRPQTAPLTDPFLPRRLDTLRIMGFNIWHGGNETGAVAGPRRVVDIIRESGAEVVGLIETYGSGARIADELGYYFYLHSSNLAILSRYPIEAAEDIFRPFNCSAVTIRVSATQTIRYINLWLHYLPSTDSQLRDRVPVDSILRGEWSTRASELKQILAEASAAGLLDDTRPTFLSGDFNIASHLDWTPATKKHHSGYVIPWPTSRLMEEAGFRDSFRERWPNPATHPGDTWSPVSKDELQYRIDFIYYRGPGVRVVDSRTIDTHPVRFPSDHAALLSVFALD